jgi:hypothetical protein
MHYHTLGPLAPKPYTHKLIGMLGAIICAASIIFSGYMSVGLAGECVCVCRGGGGGGGAVEGAFLRRDGALLRGEVCV